MTGGDFIEEGKLVGISRPECPQWVMGWYALFRWPWKGFAANSRVELLEPKQSGRIVSERHIGDVVRSCLPPIWSYCKYSGVHLWRVGGISSIGGVAGGSVVGGVP
jgi:hypothetical protein